MAIPYLMAKRFGATPGLYRVLGTTATLLQGFGVAETNTSANSRYANSALQVNAKTILTFIADKIYRSTDGGTTNTAVHTVAAVNASTSYHTGLHPILVGGVVWIVAMYIDSSAQLRGLISTNYGASFTEVALGSSATAQFYDEFVWDNKLWILTSAYPSFYSWDPNTGGISSLVSAPSIVTTNGTLAIGFTSFATHKGQLYRTGWVNTGDGNTQGVGLWRHVAGTLQHLGMLQRPQIETQSAGDTHKGAMWQDPATGDLVLIYPFRGSSNYGLRCLQITIDPTTGAASYTDRTSLVIPAAIAYPNNPAGFNNSPRVYVTRDSETTPGTTKTWIHCATNHETASWSVFEFVNVTTIMTAEPGSFATEIAPPCSADEGGGARVFSVPGDYFIRPVSRTPVEDGYQFGITVHGPVGDEVVSLYPYFNQYTNPARTAMSIADVSGGGAVLNANGHQIDNVTADGTTVVYFTWLAETDSMPRGRHCRVAVRAA